MSEPKPLPIPTLHVVSWVYPNGEVFQHPTLITKDQASKIVDVLEDRLDNNYILTYAVTEGDIKLHDGLIKILKEEGLYDPGDEEGSSGVRPDPEEGREQGG